MNLRLTIALGVLLLSIAFFWVEFPVKVRAVNPAINYAIYSFFCFLLPIAIIGLGWAQPRKWLRVSAVVLAAVVGLPTGFFGLSAFDVALRIHRLGYDPSLEFLKEIAAGDDRYRLYRTNCGATCAFGLELRKEQLAPFGIKFVRPLWSFYGADDGELALLETEVQITFDGDNVARVAR